PGRGRPDGRAPRSRARRPASPPTGRAAPGGPTPRGGASRRSPPSPGRTRCGTTGGRAGGACGRRASRAPGGEPARPREPDEPAEPRGLRARGRRAEGRDPVVAPPLVVVLRVRALAGLHDQALLEHPLDGAVERARGEAQLPPRALGHVLDDPVAVAVAV